MVPEHSMLYKPLHLFVRSQAAHTATLNKLLSPRNYMGVRQGQSEKNHKGEHLNGSIKLLKTYS